MTDYQKILFNRIVDLLCKDHLDRCIWWSSDYRKLPLRKLEALALLESEAQNKTSGFLIEIPLTMGQDPKAVHLTDDTLDHAVRAAIAKAYKTLGFTRA
jgi:hypothetical protein